jgi:NhaP-type Na+/H+ or K+/H+ antiporter
MHLLALQKATAPPLQQQTAPWWSLPDAGLDEACASVGNRCLNTESQQLAGAVAYQNAARSPHSTLDIAMPHQAHPLQAPHRSVASAVKHSCCTGHQQPTGQNPKSGGFSLNVFVSWAVALALLVFIAADKLGFLQDLASASTTEVSRRQPSGRSLSGSSDSAGSSTGGHDEAHQHDAMLFLFNALILGAAISHLLAFDFMQGLHSSVALYLLGVVYALLMEHVHEHLGVLGRSYAMWMEIEPHLLLTVMLPALIAGETMTIETDVANRVVNQCLYLAGPIVIIGGFLTAVFFWLLPHGWSFNLSLTTGAILCATCPTSVVSMLKELNASPTLVVQIQGEALLNDGTAMVFYMICYNVLKDGGDFDISRVAASVVWNVLCSWGVGAALGYVFYLWILGAHNKLEHNSEIVQVSITISCAYGSYFLAEEILSMNGVLCTISACFVLANKMWPMVVRRESMRTIWQMFEYFSNTLIYFLAGGLTGKVMLKIPLGDYLHLGALYVVLNIVRMAMFYISRPMLKWLSKDNLDVPTEDSLVMGWVGVRGAVSLMLAMHVSIDRAGGMLSEIDAHRVLFYVGGITALTIVVNAQTSLWLVRYLGIGQMPENKRRVMMLLYRQLACRLDHETKAPALKEDLLNLLEELTDPLQHLQRLASLTPRNSNSRAVLKRFGSIVSRAKAVKADKTAQTPDELASEFERLKEKHAKVVEQSRNMGCLIDLPPMTLADTAGTDLVNCITDENPLKDARMIRVLNEAFLAILHSRYWMHIEAGEVVPGTNEAELLLASTKLALREVQFNLADLKYLKPYLTRTMAISLQRMPSMGTGARSNTLANKSPLDVLQQEERMLHSRLGKIVLSTQFDLVMCFTIVLNAILIGIEEGLADTDKTNRVTWLVVDIVFTVAFTAEFALKLVVHRLQYFRSGWHIFDFFLVVLGWAGTVFNVLALDSTAGNTGLGRGGFLFRMARVFRVLRVLRVFRLVMLLQVLLAKLKGEDVSMEIAEHMQKVSILKCFIRGHLEAQAELVKFFGNDGQPNSFELARLILQSSCAVYEATSMALDEEQQLGSKMAASVNNVNNSKAVAEKLEHFIEGAYEVGVVSAAEAEEILAPMREHLKAWHARLRRDHFGMMRARAKQSMGNARHTLSKQVTRLMRSSSNMDVATGVVPVGSGHRRSRSSEMTHQSTAGSRASTGASRTSASYPIGWQKSGGSTDASAMVTSWDQSSGSPRRDKQIAPSSASARPSWMDKTSYGLTTSADADAMVSDESRDQVVPLEPEEEATRSQISRLFFRN